MDGEFNPGFLNTDLTQDAAVLGSAIASQQKIDLHGLDEAQPTFQPDATPTFDAPPSKLKEAPVAPESAAHLKDKSLPPNIKTPEDIPVREQELLNKVDSKVEPAPSDAEQALLKRFDAGEFRKPQVKKPDPWWVPGGQYIADKWQDGWASVTRGKNGYEALLDPGKYNALKHDSSLPALKERMAREKRLESQWGGAWPMRIIGTLAEAVPGLIDMGATAAAGAGAGAAVGALAGSVIPGAGTATGAALGATFGANTGIVTATGKVAAGSMYLELRDKGIKHDTALPIALASGAINGFLNTGGFGALGNIGRKAMVKKLAEPAGRAILHKQLIGFAKELGVQMTYAEAQTAVDLSAKSLASIVSKNKNVMPTNNEVQDAILQSAASGAIVGTAFIGGAHLGGKAVGGAIRGVKAVQAAKQVKAEGRSFFDNYMEGHLKREGGYANNPNDPGGATKYGIASRYNPGVDVKNLTKAQAKDIYYKKYYLPSGADRIKDPSVRAMYLDSAMGPDGVGGAKSILRRAGGPEGATLESITQAILAKRKRDPNWGKFGEGWTNRLYGLKRELEAGRGPKGEVGASPEGGKTSNAESMVQPGVKKEKVEVHRPISVEEAFHILNEASDNMKAKVEGETGGEQTPVSKTKSKTVAEEGPKYSPEVQAALDALDEKYSSRSKDFNVQEGDNKGGISAQESKNINRGFAYNAEKRRIIQGDSLERVDGGLTPTELAAAIKRENSNYTGKNVVDTSTGEMGVVQHTAFGKVRVKMPDGEVRSYAPGDLTPGPRTLPTEMAPAPRAMESPLKPPPPIDETAAAASGAHLPPEVPGAQLKNAEKTNKLWEHLRSEDPQAFDAAFPTDEVVARQQALEKAAHEPSTVNYEQAHKALKVSEKAAAQKAAMRQLEKNGQVKESLAKHFEKMRKKDKVSAEDVAKLKEELKDLKEIKKYCQILGYL